MNTSDLKTDLIYRIAQLQEPGIIQDIHDLLDLKLVENQDTSGTPQTVEKEDYKSEVYLTEDKAYQDIEEWLNEK